MSPAHKPGSDTRGWTLPSGLWPNDYLCTMDESSHIPWFAATPLGVSHVIGRRLYGGNVRGTADAA